MSPPHTSKLTNPHRSTHGKQRKVSATTDGGRVAKVRMIDASTQTPTICLLSNGSYHVMITNAGGGYSRRRGSALTRWQEDFTRDNWGMFIYVRDLASKDFWSSTLQPTLRPAANYQACFSDGKATLVSNVCEVATRTDVAVASDDDVELRRITVVNHADSRREFDLTSYAEVVLDSPAADDAHPAFSKLFVQTDIVTDTQAIVCHRRGSAKQPWMFHMVFTDDADTATVSYETDRARFIGRGATTVSPQAMNDPAPLSATQGSVLDPIVSIRCPVTLDPGQSATVTYLSGVADNREACLGLLNKYRNRSVIDHSFKQENEQSELGLHESGLTGADIDLYRRLASSIIYGNSELRADPAIIVKNRHGQSSLWGFSISGDLPIVFLELGLSPELNVTRQLVRAHSYWRSKGLDVDLVIGNAEGVGAGKAFQDRVTKLVVASGLADILDKPGGIFVRLQNDLAQVDRVLFKAVARIVLSDSGRTLAEQLGMGDTSLETAVPATAFVGVPQDGGDLPPSAVSTPNDFGPLFNNGLGGFSADGREYIVTLAPRQTTPTPWVNILANPAFGTIVSESGCANTWSENAHEFLLTPWSNDPVGDSTGEGFYLRDENTGHFWSPSPWPVRGTGIYSCRHGFGYSVFTHTQEGIVSELCVYVAHDASVKFAVLKVVNHSGRSRRLSATGYVEWVLGDQRAKTMAHVSTYLDTDSGALVASNPYSMDFSDRLAFFVVDDNVDQMVTSDRTEFLGRNGSPTNPTAMGQPRLSGKTGAALDPCAALRIAFDLMDGQQKEVVFKLGVGRSCDEIRALVRRFEGVGAARAEFVEVTKYWTYALGAIQIETPDKALNTMANGWLVYQVLASRLWGRTAFYQSSGAFGFRDQLQDVMALVHTEPGLVRAHIVLSASRQYPEGDVQHWWHPPVGRGVRTRCSDDYLWLAFATCRYVSTTGDAGILDEQIHFLEGRPLNANEESYYELPVESPSAATLYEHCVRAVSHGLRFGAHGLPLMGAGDWNDGMNNVGARGKGESVWLGFFLYETIKQFVVLAQARGDAKFVALCEKESAALSLNLQEYGWDGDWFRRAYFDDGSVLGSARDDECQIDSIAQSWSVLSGVASKEHMRMAMDAVDERLVQPESDVIKLLAPPFDISRPDPGYIQDYVPGVRENGGQYTHAAVWVVMAFAALHDTQRTWELLSMLNPINHGSSPDSIALYKTEPYVLASDVYALAPHSGRGGWTWYSGSAGWLYRLMVESVLGVRRRADKLSIEPCIPPDWKSYKINYRFGGSVYSIEVQQQSGSQVIPRLSLDGVAQDTPLIALVDDGLAHQVQMRLVSGGT